MARKKAETIDLHAELIKPFYAADLEWRIQRSGVKNGKPWAFCLAYVTARAIQNRLDEVFGLYGWKNEFRTGPDGGVLCGISIRDPDTGEWITKWDGAPNTDIEKVKGGLSGAEKRAAVQWGIGRYLYRLESNFADIHDKGRYRAKTKDGKDDVWFNWSPPRLPEWALPDDEPTLTEQPKPTNGKTNGSTIKRNEMTMAECDAKLSQMLTEIGSKSKEQSGSIYKLVTNGRVPDCDTCHASAANKRLTTKKLEEYCEQLKQEGRPLSDALQEAGVANEQMQPA